MFRRDGGDGETRFDYGLPAGGGATGRGGGGIGRGNSGSDGVGCCFICSGGA